MVQMKMRISRELLWLKIYGFVVQKKFFIIVISCVRNKSFTDWLTDRPTNQRTDRRTDRLTDRPTDQPTDQPADRPTDRPTE